MPNIHTMEVPKPSTWQEFEKITWEAYKLAWHSPNLQLNGRPGQTQNGVDIYGPDNLGRPVAIQCKQTKASITKELINEEIEEAEKYDGVITTLYIATSQDHDAQLQKYARIISEERSKTKEFAVAVLFWPDVLSGLLLNSNIFKIFYPNIIFPTDSIENSDNFLAALDLGFFTADLSGCFDILFGEYGQMANEDPYQARIVSSIIKDKAQILLSTNKSKEIISMIEALIDRMFNNTAAPITHQEILEITKRISLSVKTGESSLTKKEKQAFDIGWNLGLMRYSHCDFDYVLKPEFIERIALFEDRVKIFFGGKSKQEEIIKKVRENPSKYDLSWQSMFYNSVYNQILWTE